MSTLTEIAYPNSIALLNSNKERTSVTFTHRLINSIAEENMHGDDPGQILNYMLVRATPAIIEHLKLLGDTPIWQQWSLDSYITNTEQTLKNTELTITSDRYDLSFLKQIERIKEGCDILAVDIETLLRVSTIIEDEDHPAGRGGDLLDQSVNLLENFCESTATQAVDLFPSMSEEVKQKITHDPWHWLDYIPDDREIFSKLVIEDGSKAHFDQLISAMLKRQSIIILHGECELPDLSTKLAIANMIKAKSLAVK